MNTLLLGIVGFIYVFIAINYLRAGNHGLAICFFSYAAANYGLYLAGNP